MPKTNKHIIEQIASKILEHASKIAPTNKIEIANLVCDSIIENATNVKTKRKFEQVKQKIKELTK